MRVLFLTLALLSVLGCAQPTKILSVNDQIALAVRQIARESDRGSLPENSEKVEQLVVLLEKGIGAKGLPECMRQINTTDVTDLDSLRNVMRIGNDARIIQPGTAIEIKVQCDERPNHEIIMYYIYGVVLAERNVKVEHSKDGNIQKEVWIPTRSLNALLDDRRILLRLENFDAQ